MRLTFGLMCDGPAYPDFAHGAVGVLDEAVVGPQGLISILETQLGLTGPSVSPAVRKAAYVSKVQAALSVQNDLFFARSFAVDSWATACRLLEWRDELILHGWDGSAVGSSRIDAIAAVEATEQSLPAGLADRCRAVLQALGVRPAVNIDALTVVEPRELLPPYWARLIASLENLGVVITTQELGRAKAPDLGAVQQHLLQGYPVSLQGDGSFVLVEAVTALAATEAIAEWLCHCSEEELEGTVVLCPDGDTVPLDRALAARGLPQLGLSPSSPFRGALQLLPLAFAIAWSPLDPKPLLDMLMLQQGPLPGFAARKLARALSKEPGIGGARWATAWEQIEATLLERGDERRAVDDRIKRMRAWTEGGQFSRKSGIPSSEARAIATRVAEWARGRAIAAGDELFTALANAATSVAAAVDLLEMEQLPATLINRLLEEVLAEGASDPLHVATAGGLRVVRSPAAVWDSASRIIWWPFEGPGEQVAPTPWSASEIIALEAVGCSIESPAQQAARIAWGYEHLVHSARDNLILVSAEHNAGGEAVKHPLAHQLAPIVAPQREIVTWAAENLSGQSTCEVAGRLLRREEVRQELPPKQRALWDLPAGIIAALQDRTESATSFERLVDCQLRWLLLDVMQLSCGQVAEIPRSDQLIGNLAHELANRIFEPGPVPDPAHVKARALELFNEVASAIAAPLHHPAHAGELATARRQIPRALEHLARLLLAKGVAVLGTEVEREGKFGSLHVKGRIDLVVEHPVHGPAVIDLKWTKSIRRRRAEVTEGRALQLATYGAIAATDAAPIVPGAYYLLNQRLLLGPSGLYLLEGGIEAERTLGDTWVALSETWRHWHGLASRGVAVASGTDGAAAHIAHDLPFAPGDEPCRYCELNGLCRVTAEEN